jgi:hypothetical protein
VKGGLSCYVDIVTSTGVMYDYESPDDYFERIRKQLPVLKTACNRWVLTPF